MRQDHEETDTDSDDNNDLENATLAFDKDQADAIRFYKGGSVKSGSLQLDGSMHFLNNTLSPTVARRTMISKANIDIGHHFASQSGHKTPQLAIRVSADAAQLRELGFD